MKMPEVGANIQIVSLKHDLTLHRRWLENTVYFTNEQVVIGGNNKTIVEEKTKTWRTNEPALFYFHQRYWFNIIIIFQQPTQYYFYCNLSSPFTYQQQTIQYVDYDIDVIVNQDFSYKIVDEEEFRMNKHKMDYPKEVEQQTKEHLSMLEQWITSGRDPFNHAFVEKWYQRLVN